MKEMSQRQERVAEQIRKEMGVVLSRGGFMDPIISPLLTVAHVWISPDLKMGRVFVNALDTKTDMKTAVAALNAERHVFQQALAQLPNKFTPKLKFYADDSASKTARIEELIHKNRDQVSES